MSNTQLAEQPAEPRSAKLIVQDNSPISYLMDSAKFEHCYRIAKLMATASLIPDHLKMTGPASNKRELTIEEKVGNCFMIVNQAIRWGMDPFSIAPETYVVGGKLAFQGKLVAAVVNGLANLEERLSYTFSGQTGSDDFTITVSGKIRGESQARTVQVRVGSVKTDNQMWKKDPEQKLVYTGATKWARRHCPEVILGILIDDEIEADPMREATGRVVQEGNPFNDDRFKVAAPVETAAADPKPKAPRKKAEPEKAQEPAADDDIPLESATLPDRATMVDGIRLAFRDRKLSLAIAEEQCRALEILKKNQGFADLADEDLFQIYDQRETIFKAVAETQTEGAAQ